MSEVGYKTYPYRWVILGVFMAINMAVMGDVTTYGIEMSNSKCVVYWGSDPSESNMRGWAGLLKKKKKGDLKVIVVDPRQTKTSDAANIWLRLVSTNELLSLTTS